IRAWSSFQPRPRGFGRVIERLLCPSTLLLQWRLSCSQLCLLLLRLRLSLPTTILLKDSLRLFSSRLSVFALRLDDYRLRVYIISDPSPIAKNRRLIVVDKPSPRGKKPTLPSYIAQYV